MVEFRLSRRLSEFLSRVCEGNVMIDRRAHVGGRTALYDPRVDQVLRRPVYRAQCIISLHSTYLPNYYCIPSISS